MSQPPPAGNVTQAFLDALGPFSPATSPAGAIVHGTVLRWIGVDTSNTWTIVPVSGTTLDEDTLDELQGAEAHSDGTYTITRGDMPVRRRLSLVDGAAEASDEVPQPIDP